MNIPGRSIGNPTLKTPVIRISISYPHDHTETAIKPSKLLLSADDLCLPLPVPYSHPFVGSLG